MRQLKKLQTKNEQCIERVVPLCSYSAVVYHFPDVTRDCYTERKQFSRQQICPNWASLGMAFG